MIFSQVIMEGYEYDDVASAVKIEDITSDETNQEILRKIKENDPEFDTLWVIDDRQDNFDYVPEGSLDIGWLGYFIGKNTILREIYFHWSVLKDFHKFFKGVNRNRSIQKLTFLYMDLSGGEIFQSLGPFFQNNGNLSKLELTACQFGAGCARQFSLALRACNKSLKCIGMEEIGLGGGQLVEIFEAMSVHPQLERLRLDNMNIGRNECAALANILCSTNLQNLSLRNNAIGDEGTDVLMTTCAALANSSLGVLTLSDNNITARGCRSLAIILGSTTSNLWILDLGNNNSGDEGAQIFANALTSNRKLKTLDLHYNGITAEGWSCFSKILCDTSSINKTFLSNHTLERLEDSYRQLSIPADVDAFLALNRSNSDKKQVAIKKILKHHQHFDMQPFFEWDLKVLPLAVEWFERAHAIEDTDATVIDKQKLGAIYQFIRAMPDIVEPAPAVGTKKRKRTI